MVTHFQHVGFEAVARPEHLSLGFCFGTTSKQERGPLLCCPEHGTLVVQVLMPRAVGGHETLRPGSMFCSFLTGVP